MEKALHIITVKGGLLMTLLLLLCSCLPEPLEVKNIPAVKPEIVVSTQLIADQSLLVLLTRTFSALDFSDDSEAGKVLEQIALTDAMVSISGPGGTYRLQPLGSGFYGGVFIPFQEGAEYELRIRSESLGEVHASTRVQAMVPFSSASASIYYNQYEDSLVQVRYALQDPVGENWYMLNVQKIQRANLLRNALNPRAFTKLHRDSGMDGLQLAGQIFTEIPEDYAPGDTVAVTLSNISQEYYQFMQLRLDNRLNLMDFLGEPINYPSNVVGGKGYFNLHMPDVKFFVLQEKAGE